MRCLALAKLKILSNADSQTVPQIDAIQKQVIEIIKPLLSDQAAQICRDRTIALYGLAWKIRNTAV